MAQTFDFRETNDFFLLNFMTGRIHRTLGFSFKKSFYTTLFLFGLSDVLLTPTTFIGFITSMDSVMNGKI